MGKRRLKLRDLRRCLARFGVQEDPSAGKGSHAVFWKQFPEGVFTYPVPTTRDDVLPVYVKGCRVKFRLRVEDGISDQEFFNE